MNKSLNELHGELIQPTGHLAGIANVQQEPQELEDLCSLWLHPITAEEWATRSECLGDDIDFQRYVVHVRRKRYFERLVRSMEGGQ
jgi:hypothetical protein